MADARQLGNVVDETITPAEGASILDRVARNRLGLSGSEFLARWDRGDYADLDHVAVMEVAMLIPLAR